MGHCRKSSDTDSVYSGKDIFVSIATGHSKSLCFYFVVRSTLEISPAIEYSPASIFSETDVV